MNIVERKDIEERSKARTKGMSGENRYGGRSNWDTYETSLILSSDEGLQRSMESWSNNFNKKLRDGTFNEEKAKEALRKYLLKEAIKQDEDIDLNKVNMDEFLDEVILMNDPLPPRKKDYIPKVREPEIESRCRERNMDYVPGYKKNDGTWVKGYCRHTKFTEYMNEKRRR